MKIGDKVKAISKTERNTHPDWYPNPGTVGTVTNTGYSRLVEVQWPEGSTSEDDLWWVDKDDLEVVV